MNGILGQYIYQSSILLELILILTIIYLIRKPRYMTALILAILLLRPNERFECFIPYPKIVLSILIAMIGTRISDLKHIVDGKCINKIFYFILLVIVQTALLHREDLVGNAMFISAGLLLFVAIILYMNDEDGMTLLSSTTVFSCFLICLEPLYYHYTEPAGSELWKLFHLEDRIQAWGMWANANETSFIACLGTANMVALVVRLRRRVDYLSAGIVLPFFSLVVFLTGSRAGLMSLVLIFVPSVFLINSKLLKSFIVLVIVGLFAVSQVVVPERTDKEASKDDRYELRHRGIELFLENPVFGIGFQRGAKDVVGQPFHNTYVQAFAETGVAGGALLVIFIIGLGREIFSCYKRCVSQGRPTAYLAVVAGLFLSSAFYFYWGNQLLTLLFFLIAAQFNLSTKSLESTVLIE